MPRPRRKPYTEMGVRRLKCYRASCTNKAEFQWQICSDGNVFRPICRECDIAMNRLVLEFMELRDVDSIIENYKTNNITEP